MGERGLSDPNIQCALNNLSNNLATSIEQQDRVHPYINLQQQHRLPGGENNDMRQSNWREAESSIRRKWEYVLDHGLFTDLEFYIGKRRECIKAHTLIFKLQSSKFAEKYPLGDCKTEFDWIEPGPFRHFLKYLYTETINVGIEDALWILIIADYFEITKLVRICEEKIMKDLNVGNAAFVYQKAHDFECGKLEQLAKEYIIKHTAAVFETDGILQLTSDSIAAVLQSSAKNIHELQAFQAILRWAKAQYLRDQCGDLGDMMGMVPQISEPDWTAEHVIKELQRILRDTIGHINFREFTNIDFTVHVVSSKILSPEDSLTILAELTVKYASSGTCPAASSALPLNIPGKTYTLDRYKGPVVEEYWREETGTDRISFKVNKPVTIIGLGLYGSSEAGGETPEKVEGAITQYDEAGTLGRSTSEMMLPKPAGIFEFRFENPIHVWAGEWYTIHVTMSQVKPYGTGGRKKYETPVEDDVVIWEFMNAKGIAGFSLGRGQIPKIIFSA